MTWTREEVKTLQQLWSEGKTTSEIAVYLTDKTRNAVIGKAHRLGLPRRASPIVKKKKPGRPRTVEIVKTKADQYAGNGHAMRNARKPYKPSKTRLVRDETRDKINNTAYGEAVELIHLGSKQCHWPIGDNTGARMLFCGAKTVKGSYCDKHHTISKQGKLNVEKYIEPSTKS